MKKPTVYGCHPECNRGVCHKQQQITKPDPSTPLGMTGSVIFLYVFNYFSYFQVSKIYNNCFFIFRKSINTDVIFRLRQIMIQFFQII